MAQNLCIGGWSLTRTQARRNGTKLNLQGVPRDGFRPGILQTRDPSLRYRQVRLNTLEIQVVVLSQLLQLPVVVLVLILPAAIEEKHAGGPGEERKNLNPFFFGDAYSSVVYCYEVFGSRRQSIILDKK